MFSDRDREEIVVVDYDLDLFDDGVEINTYKKIPELKSEKGMTVKEQSWMNLFDDNGIAVFDTRLMWRDRYFGDITYCYIFLKASNASVKKNEGRVMVYWYKVSQYNEKTLKRVVRYNYSFNDDVLRFTDGETYERANTWHGMTHRDYTLDLTEFQEIEGKLDIKTEIRQITAVPIDFDYSIFPASIDF